MARLFQSFGESTPLESIALTAAMVLPQLLLQKPSHNTDETDRVTKLFAKLMRQGKVKPALRLLAKVQGAPLSVHDPAGEDKTVLDVLREKHPTCQDDISELIVQDSGTMQFHSQIFEALDYEATQKTAVKTDGSAGPSGVDARGFRRMYTSFGRASDELC